MDHRGWQLTQCDHFWVSTVLQRVCEVVVSSSNFSVSNDVRQPLWLDIHLVLADTTGVNRHCEGVSDGSHNARLRQRVAFAVFGNLLDSHDNFIHTNVVQGCRLEGHGVSKGDTAGSSGTCRGQNQELRRRVKTNRVLATVLAVVEANRVFLVLQVLGLSFVLDSTCLHSIGCGIATERRDRARAGVVNGGHVDGDALVHVDLAKVGLLASEHTEANDWSVN